MSKTSRAPAALAGSLKLAFAFAFAVAVAMTLLVPAPSLFAATPSKAKVHGISVSGHLTKVDGAAKTLMVRDGSGREVSLAWTAATKITGGDLKVGEIVTLRYFDKDKKHIATTIHVGPVATASATAKTSAPRVSPSPATTPK